VTSIDIKEISINKLKPFVEFPYRLYKNNRYWIPELKKNVYTLLSPKHPFWSHGECKLFIAQKGKKTVGRIAAIVNHAHNDYHKEKCGFFGFFETIEDIDVAKTLFQVAEKWLLEKGMDKIRGPVNPSTNESCGMLISAFESHPKIMMPYNPDYYMELTEKCGFKKVKDLYAYIRFAVTKASPLIERILSRLEKNKSVTIRELDMSKIEQELETAREIYNEAWSENWGFIPIAKEEMDHTRKELKPILKPQHVLFLEVDGVPAAFSLTVPDINEALKYTKGSLNLFNILPFIMKLSRIQQGRLLTLGIKKEFRNRGFELLLIKKIIEIGIGMGWDACELSWILEDNEKIIRIIEEIGGQLYKKYRLYEKPLK
jgi:hypothetical protein